MRRILSDALSLVKGFGVTFKISVPAGSYPAVSQTALDGSGALPGAGGLAAQEVHLLPDVRPGLPQCLPGD